MKKLYNGIEIPENWNSAIDFESGKCPVVPYLRKPADGGYAPEIVNIDVGRQLFIDDFLIGYTNLKRTWHKATFNGQVLRIETEAEAKGAPCAEMTSGGLWYDMEEQIYKMWYEAGFNKTLVYATSRDGIHWDRPALNPDGSNTMLESVTVDSTSVWLDYDAPAEERYKLMIREPDHVLGVSLHSARLYTSPDGIHWNRIGDTGVMGDRSTFYYDHFSRKWVFSIRRGRKMGWNDQTHGGRARAYHAASDFLTAGTWEEPVSAGGISETSANMWLRTDGDDPIDPSQEGQNLPELYNFCAIGYESVMFGLYQMWYGPVNDIIFKTGVPKITELQAAFSRDGYYYDRPVRGYGEAAFIPASRKMGTWDYGYLQAPTGGLIVYDDEIRIYYSAFSGVYEKDGKVISRGCHHGGTVGYATLRRDGFASMDGTGELLTNPLTVTKDVKYLFVNANCTGGELKAEILNAEGSTIPGFTAVECIPVTVNDCCKMVTWKNGKDLSFLTGKNFRIRFISESAELYSFWLSGDEKGASGGAVGAGYVKKKNG